MVSIAWLCSAGDDYLVAIAEQPLFREVGLQPLAELRVALGDGVLQCVYRLLAEDVGGELCEVSTGNASGAGFPAAKLITSGSAVNLSISRIAEGCKPDTRSENGFNI